MTPMNHHHILQIPKTLDILESSALIDDFLEGIMDRIFPLFSFNMLEKNSKSYYKTLIFKHMTFFTTNTQFNFVFDEKTLDKII
jgi:hypothetical protein|tara:strand:- start:1585 stop:1836 length:252 start_codon:yes stop_codon:yes gene_type:complete